MSAENAAFALQTSMALVDEYVNVAPVSPTKSTGQYSMRSGADDEATPVSLSTDGMEWTQSVRAVLPKRNGSWQVGPSGVRGAEPGVGNSRPTVRRLLVVIVHTAAVL